MATGANVTRPQARADGLLVEKVDEEIVVLDTASKEAHCLSWLAAAVFENADGRTRLEDLVDVVAGSTAQPVTVEQVRAALEQLEERGLLVGPPSPVHSPGGISRRQLVRRTAGATAAISAIPLVTSVATPAFAQGSPSRCPTAMCVSQEKGDEFCACNSPCPPNSTGAGSPGSCTSLGLTPPFFDSCFCAKCPTVGDPSPNQVPQGFEHLCPPMPFVPPPCTGDNTNGGCNNSGKPVDGICVPNDGDTSEPCIQQS